MKKYLVPILFALPVSALMAAVPGTDWEAERKHVCHDIGDRFACDVTETVDGMGGWGFLLKNGKWNEPKFENIEFVKFYRREIIAAAKAFGIDPRAAAGIFLADRTLTGGGMPVEEVLRFFDQGCPSNIARLGLIHTDTAETVKGLVERTTGHAVSEKEFDLYLMSPTGTIEYGAALLRSYQDLYSKAGVDISKRPEVLATLYNLGKVQSKVDALIAKRAAYLAKPGASAQDKDFPQPRYNFFGLFVKRNMDVIDAILDPSKPLPKEVVSKPAMKCRTASPSQERASPAVGQGE